MSTGGKHRKDKALEAADMAENGLTDEEIARKLHIRTPLIPALVSDGKRILRQQRRDAASGAAINCVPLNAVLPEA